MSSTSRSGAFVRLNTFFAVLAMMALVGCQGDRGALVSPRDEGEVPPPSFADLSGDASNVVDPDAVWWLEPFAEDPTDDPEFEQDKFNPNLTVEIVIFQCTGPGAVACDDTLDPVADVGDAFTTGIAALTDGTHYQFDWETPTVEQVFRVFAVVAGVNLGHLDIELVSGKPEPSLDPDAAVNPAGSDAPIKIMIESVIQLEGCGTDAEDCTILFTSNAPTEQILQFEDDDDDTETDFTFFVEAGTVFTNEDDEVLEAVAFTAARCLNSTEQTLDDRVDLLVLEDCFNLQATVDGEDPGVVSVSPDYTVSICDLVAPGAVLPPHPQDDLVTIVHFSDPGDEPFVELLPHAHEQGCEDLGIASASSNPLFRFASAVKERMVRWIRPEPLLASVALLDVGGGGQGGTVSSSYQAALPSKIILGAGYPDGDENGEPDVVDGTEFEAIDPDPVVQVVDANGDPVQGATVRWQITAGDGSIGSTTAETVSDANGEASVQFTLGDDASNPHTVRAFARGMVALEEQVLMPDGWDFVNGEQGTTTGVPTDLACVDPDDADVTDDCIDDVIAEGIDFTADAEPAFVIGSQTGVGDDPEGIAAGDLDANGTLDLVTANFGDGTAGTGSMSVLIGNGDGTFVAASPLPMGAGPRDVKLGDLDGDGDLDAVVANLNTGDVSIRLNQGNGTFAALTSAPTSSGNNRLALADLDGDGYLDIAVTKGDDDEVGVLLGNGDGTFGTEVLFAVGTFAWDVGVADFNGDGEPDLAVSNRDSQDVSILLGTGTGTFGSATNFSGVPSSTMANLFDLAIGHVNVNVDGHLDVVLGSNVESIFILPGNGDGTFQAPNAVSFGEFDRPTSLEIMDYNADGNPDLAVANFDRPAVSVLPGDGTGSFATLIDIAIGSKPSSLTVGAYNNDLKPDIAVTAPFTADRVVILLNNVN